MEYQLQCVCGQTIPVNAGAAGSRLTCNCGQTVEVPSLRELRRQSGQDVTANPVLMIERLMAKKELPPGKDCSRCGRDSTETVVFVAECERRWIKQPGKWDWLAVAVFSVPIALFTHLWVRQQRVQDTHQFGRDIVLDLPLRLCPACRAESRTPSEIAKALRTVPVYAQLLDRYPEAKIIQRPGTSL
jgi:hypothetical protein